MLRGLIPRNQRSWMEAVAGATGGSAFNAGGVNCVWQPRPHGELLVPFPGGLPGPEVVRRASELEATRIGCWAAAPAASWAELDARLRELGFAPGWQPHWMTARATPATAPDSRVTEPDEPPPEYDDYGRALFGLTRARPQRSCLFIAREQGRFAGHAWLHVAAGIGGLYDVFVVERYRRRGLGSALSTAASAKAAQLGIDAIALNAEFAPLYESLGYRFAGRGCTWWLHLSGRRGSAAARGRPSSP
jgi:GNAT superfamily N-acetyltransferase